MTETVVPFTETAGKLGGDAATFAKLTADAWAEMRAFLLMASACKEPTQSDVMPLLKGVVAAMGAVDKAIQVCCEP